MTDNITTCEQLVRHLGDEALRTIRMNSTAISTSTVSGSHVAFRARCVILLSEFELSDLLTLIATVDCSNWKVPDGAATLKQGIMGSIVDQVDAAYALQRLDFCFEWAFGTLFLTLDEAATAAKKVVSVRPSREITTSGECIDRLLMRSRHHGRIADIKTLGTFLEARSTMFRPVVNDASADWDALRSLGISRVRLFELMTLITNFATLYRHDQDRLVSMANEEIGS